ncbi:MAG: tRNA (adenosine(37)-N6)-threonylcarbamoyltransferase complex dimerization subunit type 1 TsaB [Deltaproteobacteria bacterium]|nr:tRNA (adenosine(37)-N6)-threonylcarbamoyltransferase complex dimerization subunit type 1 TsaB [Deltaproteobacteria bacterium]
MSVLLAIETASIPGSVAVRDPDGAISELTLGIGARERALAADVRALISARGGPAAVAGVALSIGPGSFTGLRLGLSFVKGFCLAFPVPVVGVSTLRAMAEGAARAHPDSRTLLALVDARGGEVYAAAFGRGDGTLCADERVPEGAYAAGFAPDLGDALVFGTGVDLVKARPSGWTVCPRGLWTPSAGMVGEIGWPQLLLGQGLSADDLEPRYLTRPKFDRV